MNRTRDYVDLAGRPIVTAELDSDELRLVARLKRRAKSQPGWDDFENFWMLEVAAFYAARRLTRRQTIRTAPWRIAQDVSSRLAISGRQARVPDYRDELDELIRTRFVTRRAFCEATGLSEDMLSHVLRRRKHLSIATLSQALGQIGYTLRIAPLPQAESPS